MGTAPGGLLLALFFCSPGFRPIRRDLQRVSIQQSCWSQWRSLPYYSLSCPSEHVQASALQASELRNCLLSSQKHNKDPPKNMIDDSLVQFIFFPFFFSPATATTNGLSLGAPPLPDGL